MTDPLPEEATRQGFPAAAEPGLDAGIADKSARTLVPSGGADAPGVGREKTRCQDDDGIPQTGEEDPLAQVSAGASSAGAAEFARAERTEASRNLAEDSGTSEPRTPRPTEDIDMAGVIAHGRPG